MPNNETLIWELQLIVYDLEATFIGVRGVPATAVADVNRNADRLQTIIDLLKEEQ